MSRGPTKIQPPSVAVYKLPTSASIVAHGTNSERHKRNRSAARNRRRSQASFEIVAGRPRHGRLNEPNPVERTQLRNQKLACPLRPTPRVLSGSALDRMAVALVAGQTAALGNAPLESGVGAASGKPVIVLGPPRA